MSKKIITVSREFGSGGRHIAEQVAKRLGYQYYDEQIIAKVAEETGLSEKEAQKKMREIDKKRSIHYDYYTDQKWGDARNYSISLNSSDLGYERVIDIICTLAKEL